MESEIIDSILLTKKKFSRRIFQSIVLGIFLTIISLYGGMAGYHYTENLSWLDSYVNAAMILSGMGPLANPATTAGKLFAGSYALFSGLFFIILMGVVLAPVFHRAFQKLQVEQANLKKPSQVKEDDLKCD